MQTTYLPKKRFACHILYHMMAGMGRIPVFCLGVQYVLPFFVVADPRIDHTGKFRIQLRRENLALTRRMRLNFMLNTGREYQPGSRYILTKYLAASAHYDSDMKFGAGLTLNY